MIRYPMTCKALPIAQPDTLMPLHVVEKPDQGSDAAGTADDARMQADAHHARPPLGSQAVQPVEGIATIGKKIIAGGEVAAALQAAVVAVEAVRHDEMRTRCVADPVRQIIVVRIAVIQKTAALDHQSACVGAGAARIPTDRPLADEARDDLDV